MAKIKVATIKDRFGQQLSNNLLDLLTPKGIPNDPRYRLKVEVLEKTVTQQAMRDDVTATNERIKYRVGYTLYDGADELVRGDSIAFVSYDILADPYSTTISQKKAEEDAAKIVANDITLRIGAYFHTRFER
jgi:LPS-assembly lipoprotein